MFDPMDIKLCLILWIRCNQRFNQRLIKGVIKGVIKDIFGTGRRKEEGG